ncbi:MAG TPA: hypothetical protein VF765_25065 [Polyangiaceae bacterium]
MTAPRELDHEAGARFIEKLMNADPASLDVATDEQVDAMMDAAGIEAGEPETAEQVLARGERRARERQERARVAGTAAKPASVATTKEPAPASRSRRAWIAAGVVAAAAGAAGIAAEIGRPHRGTEEIRPEPPAPAPAPLEQAALLRRQALAACDVRDFSACSAKLDEAKRLDPAGESDPRVVAARAAVEASTAAPQPAGPKPPVPSKPR